MSTEDNGLGIVEGFDESEELDDADVVVLKTEEGEDVSCAILAVVEHEGTEYAMLAPVAQLEDEEGEELEMYLCAYEVLDDGTQVFEGIDDDRTWDEVRDVFRLVVEDAEEE